MDAGSRYSRQVAFSKVGREGQERLAECRVVVVGIGALGSVIANDLARAGVGHLRLVDRDYVEEGNLQRQVLFTEADAREGRPKAEAAVEYLAAVNSSIAMEPFVTDVNAGNVERIIADADVVVDGSIEVLEIELSAAYDEAGFTEGGPGEALGGEGEGLKTRFRRLVAVPARDRAADLEGLSVFLAEEGEAEGIVALEECKAMAARAHEDEGHVAVPEMAKAAP